MKPEIKMKIMGFSYSQGWGSREQTALITTPCPLLLIKLKVNYTYRVGFIIDRLKERKEKEN